MDADRALQGSAVGLSPCPGFVHVDLLAPVLLINETESFGTISYLSQILLLSAGSLMPTLSLSVNFRRNISDKIKMRLK